jgi:hypothetical protein
VVSDQVLEHIACAPEQAVAEVFRVLRPGGFAVHTTAFMMGYPGAADFSDLDNGDFWRFSPSGLMRRKRVGNLSELLSKERLAQVDVFFADSHMIMGHFVLYRNHPEINTLAKRIPNYIKGLAATGCVSLR